MKKIIFSAILLTGALSLPITVFSCSNNQSIEINSNKSSIVNFSNENFSEIYIEFQSSVNLTIENFTFINSSTNEELIINKDESYFDSDKKSLRVRFNNKLEKDVLVNIKIEGLNKTFEIQNSKTFSIKSINDDKKYFFDLIEDISTNNIPTILESREASLVVQQNFIISLINYYINLNKMNSKDKTFFLIQNNITDGERFIEQTLIDNQIWDGEYDLNKIDNVNQNFYLLREFENSEFITPDQFVKYHNDLINKFNINSKFDLVIPDLNFRKLLSNFEKDNKNNELSFLLKHVNKIIVTSDGSAHTYGFVAYMYDKMKRLNNVYSREKTIEILNNFAQNKIESLSWDDVLNLLLLKNFEMENENSKFDFISFINYDPNVFNTLSLFDNKHWNEYTLTLNYNEYSHIIPDIDSSKKYQETFLNLFVDYKNSGIIQSGLSTYDPNKRNAIFLGSSLFRPLEGRPSISNYSRLQDFHNLRKVVQDKMKVFLDKFPPEEYNIIFKLHPYYKDVEIAKKYINLITNNLIENPIILNPATPLETLLSNDYYFSTNGLEEKSIIFRENSAYKKYEWTTFFGFQATSTTIQTTRNFYQTTFNLTKYDVANLIPFSNFPIPDEFPIVKRLDSDNIGGFKKDNYNEIKKIYGIFCPSLIYSNKELEEYDSIVLNF